MKSGILLTLLSLVFSLVLSCNHKDTYAPWQLIAPWDSDEKPSNYLYSAFYLLDDCIVENSSVGFGLAGTNLGLDQYTLDGVNYWYASLTNPCANFSIIDSNGSFQGGRTTLSGCKGTPDYAPDGSHLPVGYVAADTLYLQDYLLENWPEGRPQWDHVIYTRIEENGETSRYAFPKLCGQYLLLDEDGLFTGRHYLAVGGCEDYQAMVSRPEDFIPENFVNDGFMLLEDCIVPGELQLAETKLIVLPTLGSHGQVRFASPILYFCGNFSLIDSNGVPNRRDLSSSHGCVGSLAYHSDGSHLPDGFVVEDTLYLQNYRLGNWPEGRPEWDHVIYTRAMAGSDSVRYAFPRLCGQYLLIDEDGLPTGRHYVGVGGCEGYQKLINP